MQLHFVVALIAAHCSWSISAEANQITPIVICSNNGDLVCPSEIMQDNAQQLLKNIISAKIASFVATEPPTADVTTSALTTTSTPITITSTCMPPAVPLQSSSFGGVIGGDSFDDYNDNIAGIVRMQIYATIFDASDAISSIQVTYRLKDGTNCVAPVHGTNGTVHSFTLVDGERLTRMDGMHSVGPSDRIINTLTFYSNMNNMYGPYGGTGGTSFSVMAQEIVAFYGRSGLLLDSIGVYYFN